MDHRECPFCGDIDFWVSSDDVYGSGLWYASIFCLNCDTKGPYTYDHKTKDEAITKAWELWDSRSYGPCTAS